MTFLFIFNLTSSGHIGRKMTQLEAMFNKLLRDSYQKHHFRIRICLLIRLYKGFKRLRKRPCPNRRT